MTVNSLLLPTLCYRGFLNLEVSAWHTWYKSDLKTDSLLQVQEGPESDYRWALKAFTKGDKAYFTHSEGVW